MKRQNSYPLILTISLFTFLLIGCMPKEDNSKESSFRLIYPDVNMNTVIKFVEPREKFHLGDSIFVDLENYSENKIVFPFETLMYTYENGEWSEIKDGLIYPQEGLREIEPMSSNNPGGITVVGWPQIQSRNSMPIRVVVIGTIVQNGNPVNEKIGAYIDIPLNP